MSAPVEQEAQGRAGGVAPTLTISGGRTSGIWLSHLLPRASSPVRPPPRRRRRPQLLSRSSSSSSSAYSFFGQALKSISLLLLHPPSSPSPILSEFVLEFCSVSDLPQQGVGVFRHRQVG